MTERISELARHARRIFPEGHELAATGAKLDKIAGNFPPVLAAAAPATQPAAQAPPPAAKTAAPAGVPTNQPHPPQKPQDVPSGAGMNKVEVAEGKDLRVRFYGRRCIHARKNNSTSWPRFCGPAP